MAKPVAVTVEMRGKNAALHALGVVGAVVRDLRPFWRNEFAPRYFAMVQDVFTMEGQRRGAGGRFAKGGQWQPLSPAYDRWKERVAPDKGILELTGDLRESLTWHKGGLGAGGVFQASPTTVVVGTEIEYAAAHQYGVPERNLPARPFLDPPDARVFAPILHAWLLRSVQARGVKTKKKPG